MTNESYKPTVSQYRIGFLLSVVLTLSAFFIVKYHLDHGHRVPTDQTMVYILLGLAFLQFIVQLIFFLHIGQETKPRWNLMIFLSTVSLVFVLVAGSIWIMNHLNYNMTSSDMEKFMIQQEGIKK